MTIIEINIQGEISVLESIFNVVTSTRFDGWHVSKSVFKYVFGGLTPMGIPPYYFKFDLEAKTFSWIGDCKGSSTNTDDYMVVTNPESADELMDFIEANQPMLTEKPRPKKTPFLASDFHTIGGEGIMFKPTWTKKLTTMNDGWSKIKVTSVQPQHTFIDYSMSMSDYPKINNQYENMAKYIDKMKKLMMEHKSVFLTSHQSGKTQMLSELGF